MNNFKSISFLGIAILAGVFVLAFLFMNNDSLAEGSAGDIAMQDNSYLTERGKSFFSGNEVIAVIKGRNLTVGELINRDIHQKMTELQNSLFLEIQLAIMEEENITIPEVNVSDEEALEFYNQNSLKSRGSFESYKARIIQYLADLNKQKQFRDISTSIMNTYLKSGDLRILMDQVPGFSQKANVANAIGSKSGEIFILEYSDTQCPFCARVQQTLKNLKVKYGDQLGLLYKHLPLETHTEAEIGAIALECADKQSAFSGMKEILFQNQKRQTLNYLYEYAEKLNLDIDSFKNCMDDPAIKEEVQTELKEAFDLELNSTPSFIIGKLDKSGNVISGNILVGAVPQQEFEKSLDSLLN